MAGQNYYGTPAGNISPPSSPDVGDSRNARDVSPIDEVPDMSGLDSRPPPARAPSHSKSNIPMMRRQRRQEQEAASSTLREAKSRERLRSHSLRREQTQDGQDVSTTGRQLFKTAQGRDIRWDAMTGEPNLGPTGVSSQVKPVEYVQGLTPAKGASASTSAADGGIPTSPTASTSAIARLRNAQSTFSDKLKAMRGAADAAGAGAGANNRSPVSPGRPALSPVPAPEPASDAPPSPSALSSSPSPASARPPRKSSLGSSSLATRPEWKGASGRTTLVAPVQDTPQAAPLQIPRKSSKRERYAKVRGARGGPGGPGALSPISPSGSETDLNRADPASPNLISSPRAGSSANQDPRTAYPSPPPHSASAAPPSPAADPNSPTAPAPVRAPISVDNARAVRRKPPSAAPPAPSASASAAVPTASSQPSHTHQLSTTSSIYSTFDSQTVPHPPESYRAPTRPAATTAAPPDNWTQPPSRFSVTTYATSAHTRSSNPSVDLDAPPMPSPPRDHHQSPQSKVGAPDSGAYMSSPYTSPAAEMRKAAASGRDNNVPSYLKSGGWSSGATPSIFSERPGSVASTSKALPLAPPEIEMQSANDRVGNLNARLESLAHRRANINKSIKKMTELMPTDNLMASEAVLRKREIEKQKVEGLREELSEVQREEYELGLKLHRAYKRLDRDAEYEPTGLWVRRVTG